jgi:hypothetical protein
MRAAAYRTAYVEEVRLILTYGLTTVGLKPGESRERYLMME